MANKQARALADGAANGVSFRCNDLIEGEAKFIKDLVKAGTADDDQGAVDYVVSQGAKAIVLDAPVEEPASIDPPPAV